MTNLQAVVAVSIALIVSSCGELTEQQKATMQSEDELIEAWSAAEIIITQQLKSPGTAEWGGVFAGDWQDPREAVTKLEENLYEVTGWVDSQNSFGGVVRMDFSLRLEKVDDGWRLVGPLSMSQR